LSTSSIHVAVLGSGITGLTCAYYLLRAGARVTVIEPRPELGGLSTHYNYGPFVWDRFYHCILQSDTSLLSLLDDLTLTDRVVWTSTKVGFFADEKLHSLSTSLDFLRFPALTLWHKCRLAAGILYASRIKDGSRLEAELASHWLQNIFGKNIYQQIWEPLLKCKLGLCCEEASAAFIWATIARLHSTRQKTSGRESLGYVRGGYRTVFEKLIGEIGRLGGQIIKDSPIRRVSRTTDSLEVVADRVHERYDRVIATLPSPLLAEIAPQLDSEYLARLLNIKYLGVICFALVLRQPLTPYYVTNIAVDVPFTGIIEMTNLISLSETAGHHLVYLPKYTSPKDPTFEEPADLLWQRFETGLRRIIPSFNSSDVVARHLSRERYVQPLPVLHYSTLAPPMLTNMDGLFVANTSQLVNSTVNNNEMVKIANRAVHCALAGHVAEPRSCASTMGAPSNDALVANSRQ
jgi:protoporphyrinogen oxidase